MNPAIGLVACPIVKNSFGIRIPQFWPTEKLGRSLFGISHFDSSGLPFHGIIAVRFIDLGDGSMNHDVVDCVEGDETILTVDIPDDTLERAAGSIEGHAVTWMYCTHVWYNCGWPQ